MLKHHDWRNELDRPGTRGWQGLTSTMMVAALASLALHAPAHGTVGDFDGDGFADLALGVPFEDVGGVENAGAVHVIYGGPGGLDSSGDEFWHQDRPGIQGAAEAEDWFGYKQIVAGDFDGDGIDDLAIGVPFEDVDDVEDAGAVNVIYGSSSGLNAGTDQLWHQNVPGVQDAAEDFDFLGDALAAGDFNGDGFDDLAIGVEFEDVGGIKDCGAVHVLYGSNGGLTAVGDEFWHQNSAGVKDVAEADDLFGLSLAAADFDGDGRDDLAVGVPDESIGGAAGAGAVNLLYGTNSGLSGNGDEFWHQNRAGISSDAEDGDFFGGSLAVGNFGNDGRADLAIGASDEDIGGVADAGAVHVLYGSSSGLSGSGSDFLHQDVSGVSENAQAEDLFGLHLAAGDFDGDGRSDLAVGVEQEDLGPIVDAGAVHIFHGKPAGISVVGDQFWHQDRSGIAEAAQTDDEFGSALSAGDFDNDGFDDLAVQTPFEDFSGVSDAGAANVLYGRPGGLDDAGDQLWNQNSSGIADVAEDFDNLGFMDDPF